VQLLTQTLIPITVPESDPLRALFGSIHSNVPDLADRHDYHIGQSLYEEMHGNE